MKFRALLYFSTDDDKLLISLTSTFYRAGIYLWNMAPCILVEIFGGFGENYCHHDYSDYFNYGWNFTDLNKLTL
jgi:hypothetical protein